MSVLPQRLLFQPGPCQKRGLPVFHFLIIWLGVATPLIGQSSFRTGYEAADPAPFDLEMSAEERLVEHQLYQDSVREKGTKLEQLYALSFLFMDNIREEEYAKASAFLVEAESIAEESENPSWQGFTAYRRGQLRVKMRHYEDAISAYKESVDFCTQAGDSLCMAEGMEQLSAMYVNTGDFETSQAYFDQAYPLLQKYGSEGQLAVALNNFGTLLNRRGQPLEAIPYFDQALEIYTRLDIPRSVGKAMHNIADSYGRMGQYDIAIERFKACVAFNQERGFYENLVVNYFALRKCYASLNDYEQAYRYAGSYIKLRDSIRGHEVQNQILQLELDFKEARHELENERAELLLENARHQLRVRMLLIGGVLLLSLFLIAYYLRRLAREKQRIMEKRKELNRLARLLRDKNSAILELESKIKEQAAEGVNSIDPLVDFFDRTILTEKEWSEFKQYFNEGYPGYIQNLRKEYTTITDAEERLFLLIKLQLNSKEIAAVLGISVDSVKKTRNRLRKRMELNSSASLEAFVQEFQPRRGQN